MKNFSEFLVEKEDYILNSKGERVPMSKATRQDVGMAPKDLENVTSESETKPISKSGKKITHACVSPNTSSILTTILEQSN